MSANNSQIGNTPSELLFGNNENKSNLDQLLSVEIATTSQPLIQFTTTDMIPTEIPLIPHVPETSNITRRQEGRRRRRQRQRPSELRLQQQHQREQRPRRLPSRTWSEIDREHEYLLSRGFPEYMEEYLTPLLEEYVWEKMDPKTRWEQEQLYEFEGFVVLEHLALIQDENEQLHQIELLQKLQENEQQERNYDELVQLQQWEHITFLVQQLNQN